MKLRIIGRTQNGVEWCIGYFEADRARMLVRYWNSGDGVCMYRIEGEVAE